MAEEVALFPSMPAPPLALLRCRWRHPHRARAAPPWNLPVLVRASGGTHGDTIFGENDTSARLASELLAQVAPPLYHYPCSPARIDIFEMAGRAGVALARDRQNSDQATSSKVPVQGLLARL